MHLGDDLKAEAIVFGAASNRRDVDTTVDVAQAAKGVYTLFLLTAGRATRGLPRKEA